MFLLKNWIFLNYCFQRIGMWPKPDLDNGILRAFRIQLFTLLAPLFFVPYVYFSGKPGLGVFIIGFIAYFIINNTVIKQISKFINIKRLEEKYNAVNRISRILAFVLGLIITLLSPLFLIFSFRILNYL